MLEFFCDALKYLMALGFAHLYQLYLTHWPVFQVSDSDKVTWNVCIFSVNDEVQML